LARRDSPVGCRTRDRKPSDSCGQKGRREAVALEGIPHPPPTRPRCFAWRRGPPCFSRGPGRACTSRSPCGAALKRPRPRPDRPTRDRCAHDPRSGARCHPRSATRGLRPTPHPAPCEQRVIPLLPRLCGRPAPRTPGRRPFGRADCRIPRRKRTRFFGSRAGPVVQRALRPVGSSGSRNEERSGPPVLAPPARASLR